MRPGEAGAETAAGGASGADAIEPRESWIYLDCWNRTAICSAVKRLCLARNSQTSRRKQQTDAQMSA